MGSRSTAYRLLLINYEPEVEFHRYWGEGGSGGGSIRLGQLGNSRNNLFKTLDTPTAKTYPKIADIHYTLVSTPLNGPTPHYSN